MYEYRTPLLAALGIFALIVWSLEYFKVFKKPQLFIPEKMLPKDSTDTFPIRFFVYLIGLVAWLLISFSMAGPRIPKDFTDSTVKVNDIFFVVDVSRSMLAEDFKPNRLEVAKKNILEFIKLRPTDRIGIIIFSREVFTLMPLTTDLKLIEQTVSDIKVGKLGSATNIGDALGLAVARSIRSESKNKVIVLLTDGVSNAGNIQPIDAAQKAKESGIKVYTIGVGSQKGAKLPIGNSIFGKRYQNIPGGSIDIKLLREIAKLTGARAYLAENEGALQDVLTRINQLEKTEIKVSGQIVYKEEYHLYLLLGVLLLIGSESLRRFVLREVA